MQTFLISFSMFVVCLLLIRMWVSILLSSNAYFFWLVTSRHASGVHVDVRVQWTGNKGTSTLSWGYKSNLRPGTLLRKFTFLFFFFTFYFLRTLDFAPSTLDMLPSTKTQTLRTIVRLRKRCTGWSRMLDKTCCNYTFTGLIIKSVAARCHWGYILTCKAVFNGPVSCESLYFVHYFCLSCLPIFSDAVDTLTDQFVWLQADTAVSRRRTA